MNIQYVIDNKRKARSKVELASKRAISLSQIEMRIMVTTLQIEEVSAKTWISVMNGLWHELLIMLWLKLINNENKKINFFLCNLSHELSHFQ